MKIMRNDVRREEEEEEEGRGERWGNG